MSGSGWEVLSNVREWSGNPPRCPRVIERSSEMSGSVWEASRMSGSCREDLPDVREALLYVRERSGVPPGSLGVVGRPSRMSNISLEAILDVREWSGVPLG